MDLSLHTCQECPTAISNRVEKWKLFSLGTIDQMAYKSQNNFCVNQACLEVPLSQGASVSPTVPVYFA